MMKDFSLVGRRRRKLRKLEKAAVGVIGMSGLINVVYADTDIGRVAFYVALAVFAFGVALLATDQVLFRRGSRANRAE